MLLSTTGPRLLLFQFPKQRSIGPNCSELVSALPIPIGRSAAEFTYASCFSAPTMASSIIVLRSGRQLLSVFYCTISGQVLQEFLLNDVSPLQVHLQHVIFDIQSLSRFEPPQNNMLAGTVVGGGVVLIDLILMQMQRIPSISNLVMMKNKALALIDSGNEIVGIRTLSFLFAAASLPLEFIEPSRLAAIKRFQRIFRRIQSQRTISEAEPGKLDMEDGSGSIDYEDSYIWRDTDDAEASPSRRSDEARSSWSIPSVITSGLGSAYRSISVNSSTRTSLTSGVPTPRLAFPLGVEMVKQSEEIELHITAYVPEDTTIACNDSGIRGIFDRPSESFEICVSAVHGLGLSLRVRDDLR